ncbi:MAG TPA: HAD family hydrolase, partial [Candidatus Methylomirabilis sp.]|nr:HAD family hydrolase [Candidatus Methylomirabilis sp.]
DRLPLVTVAGKEIRTTSAAAHAAVREAYPAISLERFSEAFVESLREVNELRDRDGIEVTAAERIARCFARLGLPNTEGTAALRAAAVEAHMGAVAAATTCPPDRREVVRSLASRYRLGLVSNFDHGGTARALLRRHGFDGIFEVTLISADVGFRKPRREIFDLACRALGILPAVGLFVGDSLSVDVAGARGVGMPCVWLNREGLSLHPADPQPEYTIRRLPDLLALL